MSCGQSIGREAAARRARPRLGARLERKRHGTMVGRRNPGLTSGLHWSRPRRRRRVEERADAALRRTLPDPLAARRLLPERPAVRWPSRQAGAVLAPGDAAPGHPGRSHPADGRPLRLRGARQRRAAPMRHTVPAPAATAISPGGDDATRLGDGLHVRLRRVPSGGQGLLPAVEFGRRGHRQRTGRAAGAVPSRLADRAGRSAASRRVGSGGGRGRARALPRGGRRPLSRQERRAAAESARSGAPGRVGLLHMAV